MGKFAGKEEYHDIYPEFNPPREDMIRHKERRGAEGLLLAALLLAALTSLVTFYRSARVRPTLVFVTETSARVEVVSDLTGSEFTYPLLYQLFPYWEEKEPVSPGGQLLLSQEEVDALPLSIREGMVNDSHEELFFEALEESRSYLLLLYARGAEDAVPVLRREALWIRLPAPGEASKGGMAPVTPTPSPAPIFVSAAPSPTATPTPTPSPSPSPTATPTPTPTPTPSPTPYTGGPTVKKYSVTVICESILDDTPGGTGKANPASAAANSKVTIAWEPEDGFRLAEWYAVDENDNEVSLTETGDRSMSLTMGRSNVTVYLFFDMEDDMYTTSVAVSPADGGTASASPAFAAEGTVVTIETQAATGYSLDHCVASDESGSVALTDNGDGTFSFTIGASDVSVEVFFTPNRHTVTVISGDGGQGTVNGSPGSTEAAFGDTVIVNGNPEEGFMFRSWTLVSGSVQESFSGAFVMGNEDVVVMANFVPARTVTVINDSPSMGTCSPEGARTYAVGDTVTILCTPEDGCMFSGASDSLGRSYSASPIVFEMGEENVIVMVFFTEIPTYPVSILIDPEGSGSATLSPVATDLAYPAGTTVTVTATPASGYAFAGMEINGTAYSSSTQSFTVGEEGAEVIVHFAKLFSVSVVLTPEGGGSYSLSSSQGKDGDVITFHATPADGYIYDNSYEIVGTSTWTDSSVTIEGDDIVIFLYFDEKTLYSVTVNVSGDGGTASGPTAAAEGDTVSITCVPESGYHFKTMWVNGTAYGTTTFTMPASDAVVWVEFELD